jgi:hypothetical protein
MANPYHKCLLRSRIARRGRQSLWLSLSDAAVLDGRWIARVSIGALTTEAADVAAVWAAMREAAEGTAERL